MSYDFCWHTKKGRRTEVAPSINSMDDIAKKIDAFIQELEK